MRNNLLNKATGAVLFSLLMLLTPALQAQNCVGLSLHPNQDEIMVTGLWSPESPDSIYTGYFQLRSNQDTTYEFVVTSLVDELNNSIIRPEHVQLSAQDSKLLEDRVTEFSITVSSVKAPGRYLGKVQILQKGGEKNNCYLEKDLVVEIYQPGMATVEDTDLSQVVKTVKTFSMEYLLPKKIRQSEISFVVHNDGATPITFTEYSFILKGEGTQITLTDQDVIWLDEGATLAPRSQMVMRFSIPDTTRKKLEADQYAGAIILNPSHVPDSLAVGLTLYSRTGVFWAIVALLIGIMVGRMIKSVNNNKVQMEAMQKFVPVRDGFRTVNEESAKKSLLEDASRVEAQINELKGEEGVPEVISSIELLGWKVNQMNKLEDTYEEMIKLFRSANIQEAAQVSVLGPINVTKDAILAGDKAATTKGYADIQASASEMFTRSRGGLSTAPPSPEELALEEQVKGLDAILQKEEFRLDPGAEESKGALENSGNGYSEFSP